MPHRHLVLHLIKDRGADDGFVAVLHIILRDLALVYLRLFREEIHGIAFLQERVPLIFFVDEDALDRAGVPFLLTRRCPHPFFRKPPGYGIRGMPLQEQPVYPADDFCLFLV